MAVASLLEAQTLQEEPKGVIEGVVRRSDTLATIAEVSLVLNGPRVTSSAGVPTGPSQILKTDIDGRFMFKGLPPGSYQLQASRDGYFSGGRTPSSRLLNLGPGPQESASNIRLDILLDPGAIFSGRVLDDDGRPIAEVPVSFTSLGDGVTRFALSPGFSPRTNNQGEYRLGLIAPGEYRLRAEFPGTSPELVNRTTYYPDSIEIETARRLIATPGAEYTGLDIRVRKSAAVTVSGSVIRAERVLPENSSARLSLYLYPRGSRTPDIGSAIRRIDSTTGKFEIPGVVPGVYELVVIESVSLPDTTPIDARNVQSRRSGRISVGVGTRDVDGLSVVLKDPIEVKGRVIAAEGISLPKGLKVTLNYEGLPSDRPDGGAVDEKGEFYFRGAAEGSAFHLYPYGLGFGELPSDLYLRDIRQGSRSIMNDGLIVFSSPPEPVEFLVSAGAAAVEGTVSRTERGQVAVVLVPDEPRRGNPALYRTALTDDQNHFVVTGMAPGLYKIFCWEGFLPSPAALVDPEFLVRYENRGTMVNLVSGSRLSNVRVNSITKGQ